MTQTVASSEASATQTNPNDWSGSDAGRGSAPQTQFISFAIGDDQYGVDIMAVREIKGWSDITHLPKHPEYVRGVLNLRGAIVPIVCQIASNSDPLSRPIPTPSSRAGAGLSM